VAVIHRIYNITTFTTQDENEYDILFHYLTHEDIPEWALARVQEIETIRLQNRNISFIPQWFENLHNLRHLYIISCHNLHTLPDIFYGTPSMEFLSIIETPIEYLPKSAESLHNLKKLYINTPSMNLTTFNFSQMTLLEEVGFGTIKSLVLSDSVGTLSNLRSLVVYSCGNFESVPSWIYNLKGLEDLRMIDTGLFFGDTFIFRFACIKNA